MPSSLQNGPAGGSALLTFPFYRDGFADQRAGTAAPLRLVPSAIPNRRWRQVAFYLPTGSKRALLPAPLPITCPIPPLRLPVCLHRKREDKANTPLLSLLLFFYHGPPVYCRRCLCLCHSRLSRGLSRLLCVSTILFARDAAGMR